MTNSSGKPTEDFVAFSTLLGENRCFTSQGVPYSTSSVLRFFYDRFVKGSKPVTNGQILHDPGKGLNFFQTVLNLTSAGVLTETRGHSYSLNPEYEKMVTVYLGINKGDKTEMEERKPTKNLIQYA